MKDEIALVEKEKTINSVTKVLLEANSCVRNEVVAELAQNRRLLKAGEVYADEAYVPMSEEESKKWQSEYERRIREEVERQIDLDGTVTLTMFTCLNGNPKLLREDSGAYIPPEFDENQVFFQRTRVIFWLLSEFKNVGVPLNINLILGDSDIVSYYTPILEYAGIDVDLDAVARNIRSLRASLSDFLVFNNERFGNVADVISFGDDAVSLRELRGGVRNSISVVSLVLNTDLWGYPDVSNITYDPADFEDSYSDLRAWVTSSKFDPVMFRDCPDEVMKRMVLGKYGSYRDQGEYVGDGGLLVLMDELPPQWKCRMLSAGNPELLYLLPWIRKEDPLRNPQTIEGGSAYDEFEQLRARQAPFGTKFRN